MKIVLLSCVLLGSLASLAADLNAEGSSHKVPAEEERLRAPQGGDNVRGQIQEEEEIDIEEIENEEDVILKDRGEEDLELDKQEDVP